MKMKLCPQCNLKYSDDTLEFCLEDGARLVFAKNIPPETLQVTVPFDPKIATEKTFNLPFSNQPATIDFRAANNIQNATQTDSEQKHSSGLDYKVLEISSIAFSLAHNWWQWVYLNNQYYSSFSSYVLSANFLMWLLLLIGGTGISLYALRQAQNKTIPIISLITLAINLILFLVPKR